MFVIRSTSFALKTSRYMIRLKIPLLRDPYNTILCFGAYPGVVSQGHRNRSRRHTGELSNILECHFLIHMLYR
jgi:hypothetical protein